MELAIILALWAVAFVAYRMHMYYHREATYWKTHIEVIEIISKVAEHHPEAKEAFNCLFGHLKENGDLHLMEEGSRTKWERFRLGGRL